MIRAGRNMRHITVHLMREDLPRASFALAEMEAFVPDERPLLADDLALIPGEAFRGRYSQARSHLERIVALMGMPEIDDSICVLRREQMIERAQWLEQAWGQCAPMDARLHEIDEKLTELDHLGESLNELAGLDIDLGKLQGNLDYLDLKIGSLPAANVERLREALALEDHMLINVAGEGEAVRVAIAGIRRPDSSLENVLSSAGFQALEIPESFQDEPEKERAELHAAREALQAERDDLVHQIDNWCQSNARELSRARKLLCSAQPYVELGEAARAKGNLAALQGWLPDECLEEAQQQLGNNLSLPFTLEARRPRRDERELVPIPPMRSRWLRPFTALMQNYGVPRFSEIDPTLLFAITFALMFGMMFGDVGHGLVFVLIGIVARRKLGHFWILFLVAGGMAMLFGFLYGSIFGVEHWLHPLWIAPMSDPMYMLSVALIWGVVFLSVGSVIAITNRLTAGDVLGAMFDPGGVFSLALYYALLGGIYSVMQGDGFPLVATLVLVVTLTALVAYQWHESDAPRGERVLVIVIETFEIINGYVSNSLSFLRLAAFSLNHVALSLAVFTLADMMDGVGHWVMIVFGNLFIIVLEGMIVTIQTLRLEYYEGFSRYFYGDGTRYQPLVIKGPPSPVSASTTDPRREVSS